MGESWSDEAIPVKIKEWSGAAGEHYASEISNWKLSNIKDR